MGEIGAAGQTVPQAGYMKGPTLTDKVDALRFDLRKDLDAGMFTDVQFGVNYSKRSKDRITDEGLIVSTQPGGYGNIPYPADAYVINNVAGTGINVLTFDPTENLWPGATLLRKFNDDILSKSWTVQEKVTTAYGRPDLGERLGTLAERLASRRLTVVVVGEFKAGKSSLVNAIVGADRMDTGAVRSADDKGRHTTVTRELIPFPGGVLIDTPGLRGIGLQDADEGIERVYADIEALAAQCRFADCQHRSEPGCVVRAAIDDDELDADRLDRYERMLRESQWAASRGNARAERERQEQAGRIQREPDQPFIGCHRDSLSNTADSSSPKPISWAMRPSCSSAYSSSARITPSTASGNPRSDSTPRSPSSNGSSSSSSSRLTSASSFSSTSAAMS